MENKSYPEMLHEIFVEFGNGNKDIVTPFERSVTFFIDKMITEERKKLSSNEHYLKNDNMKADCQSCSRHDAIIGCGLKHKNKCIDGEKYTKYRRAHMLPCDRCKTYSVITKIDKVHNSDANNNIPRPMITFTCVNCKDHPTIDGRIFRGYELRGMEFTEKYLNIHKQREQRLQKEQHVQQEKHAKPEITTLETVTNITNNDPEIVTQEVEIVAH